MTIQSTRTLDGRWLVAGADPTGTEGVTLLESESWNKVVEYHEFQAKKEEFEGAVTEFFAPILSAVETLTTDDEYDWSTVVITEPEDGELGVSFKLDGPGTVLRLIEESDQSTLRWVNGDLVALA